MPCVSVASGVGVARSLAVICRVAALLPRAALQAEIAETRIAASRNGTIAVAIAAPSPRLPPGIARWNDSVAIRCVALSGPPRVST